MRVELDTSEIGALAARLRRLDEAQTTDLLGRLGGELVDGARYRIRISEASPEGVRYPALSPRHARRTADPTDFLQDGGGLLRSLQALVAGDEAVDVGSPLPSAAAQQFGSRRRRIPARAYLGIGEDEADELELISATFLDAALRGEETSRA